jgi:hypothetical protein
LLGARFHAPLGAKEVCFVRVCCAIGGFHRLDGSCFKNTAVKEVCCICTPALIQFSAGVFLEQFLLASFYQYRQ